MRLRLASPRSYGKKIEVGLTDAVNVPESVSLNHGVVDSNMP